MLITYSYFENNDKNLLVSGLVTFFIWVLNLYISCSVLIVSGIVDSSEHVTINSLMKVSSDGDMSKSVDTIARRLSDRAGMVTGEIAVNEAGTCDASLVQNEVDKSAVEQRDAEIHEKISQLTKQIKESEMEYKELLNEANVKEKAARESEFEEPRDPRFETKPMNEEPSANPIESAMNPVEVEQIDSNGMIEEQTCFSPSNEPIQTETLREIEERLNQTNEILNQIHPTIPIEPSSHTFEPNPQSTSSIQSWMNRNGVSPIVPEGDLSEHSRAIERKINRFISKVTHSSHSNTPLVFQPTSSIVQAMPLLPAESPQLMIAPPIEPSELIETTEPMNVKNPIHRVESTEPLNAKKGERQREKPVPVQYHPPRHRALDKSDDVIPKRRNIQKGPAATSIASNPPAKPSNEIRKRPVRYVRRLGQRRIVAGAICQSCFLDGLDENGEVITSVQVRNVGLGMMRLKRREPVNQGEELEEPRHRGVGLFGGEDENENENENEYESGMEQFYNHELDVSEMERELDRQIRQLRNPTPSLVCSTNNTIYDLYDSSRAIHTNLHSALHLGQQPRRSRHARNSQFLRNHAPMRQRTADFHRHAACRSKQRRPSRIRCAHHQNLALLKHRGVEVGRHHGDSFHDASRCWDPTNYTRRQALQLSHRFLGERNHRALRTFDHARKRHAFCLEKKLLGFADFGSEVGSGESALLEPKQIIELQVHHVADLVDPPARLQLSADLENGAMDGEEDAKQRVPKMLAIVHKETRHRQERRDFFALR